MQLNFKSFGSGPALVILHGLFGSLDNWQTLARRFAEHYSVYIVDQRNHGKSPHTDVHTYELMAEDLLDFLDDEGIYQANLIGHSMGGKTVMQFAASHEDRIEKLIVADMGIQENKRAGHAPILEALRRFPMDTLDSRQQADELLKLDIQDYGIRQFLLKNIDRNPDKSFRWKFNFPVLYNEYERILAGIEFDHPVITPALFVRGGTSNYILDEDWPAIQEVFQDASLRTIPNAGHWVHAEAPDAFYETVLEFLLS